MLRQFAARSIVLFAIVAAVFTTHAIARPDSSSAVELPSQLSDAAFWKLSQDASEPGGYFRSQDITNLTSNELWFQYVIPDLVRRAGSSSSVYLGVGPEQNYTYIAALR